jgi:hypothetical protein
MAVSGVAILSGSALEDLHDRDECTVGVRQRAATNIRRLLAPSTMFVVADPLRSRAAWDGATAPPHGGGAAARDRPTV